MKYSLNHLKIDIFKLPGDIIDAKLIGELNIPEHGTVTVVVYPHRGQSLEDLTITEEAEPRFERIISALPSTLSNGTELIKNALCRYYPNYATLPDREFIEGLKLEVVKVILRGRDELFFRGNKRCHGLDLNVILNSSQQIVEAWMDG